MLRESFYIIGYLDLHDPRGHAGALFGTDLKSTTDKKVRELLNNANCRPLMNEPKIILWACCHSGKHYYHMRGGSTVRGLLTELVEQGLALPQSALAAMEGKGQQQAWPVRHSHSLLVELIVNIQTTSRRRFLSQERRPSSRPIHVSTNFCRSEMH